MYAGKLCAAYPGGPVERAVLTTLALFMSHTNPKKPVAPSVDTLARLTGFTGRRVRRALVTLAREGWIAAAGARTGGFKKPTPYRVNVELVVDQFPDRTKHLNPEPGSAFDDQKPGTNCTETRNEVDRNPERSAPKTRNQVPPNKGFEQGFMNKGFEQGDAPARTQPTKPKANAETRTPFFKKGVNPQTNPNPTQPRRESAKERGLRVMDEVTRLAEPRTLAETLATIDITAEVRRLDGASTATSEDPMKQPNGNGTTANPVDQQAKERAAAELKRMWAEANERKKLPIAEQLAIAKARIDATEKPN